MDLEIKGRRALVKAASRGLGRAIAWALRGVLRVDGGMIRGA